jgi:hypothetical protein
MAKTIFLGHAIAQVVVSFPLLQPGFDPRSGSVRFVMNKVALG